MKSYMIAPIVALAASTAYACDHSIYRREAFSDLPAPEWGYDGERGPVKWATLDESFATCANGSYQSPINLDDTIVLDAGCNYQLTIPDIPGGATVENVGWTIQVPTNGTLEFDGKVYELSDFHFHSPGEHLFDGRNYVLEAHFRFAAADGSLANIGVPIAMGAETYPPVFENVLGSAGNVTEVGAVYTTPALTFVKLIALLSESTVYRYTGSLTNPPCTEGVEWIVSNTTATIDYETFLAAKGALKFNARFPQGELGAPNLLSTSELAA